MVDQVKMNSKPASMLEQELSQDTLDAIKAIVSDGGDTEPADIVQDAITESVSALRVDEEPAEKSVECAEGTVDSSTAIEDEVAIETAPEIETDVDAAVEPVAMQLKEPAQPEVTDLSVDDPVEDQSERPEEPILDLPDHEVALIRETVASAENVEDHAKESTNYKENTNYKEGRGHSEAEKPPSMFGRLKQSLRNRIRLRFLILKMKLRDRTPTKKEFIQSLTPRRLAIAVMVAVALIKPWFYPTAAILLLLLGGFVLLLMGTDRIRHYLDLAWRRYKRLHPEEAVARRTRAMDLMERWQAKLERLPFRWAQGVHLPQFQSEAEKSAAESAYASRMARIAQDDLPKSYS